MHRGWHWHPTQESLLCRNPWEPRPHPRLLERRGFRGHDVATAPVLRSDENPVGLNPRAEMLVELVEACQTESCDFLRVPLLLPMVHEMSFYYLL